MDMELNGLRVKVPIKHTHSTLHCSLEAGKGCVHPDDIVTRTWLRGAVKFSHCTAVEQYLHVECGHGYGLRTQ